MYLIKHIKNNNFYKLKISNNLKHYVFDKREARRFRTKKEAEKFLNTFNHQEHFEIVKI